MSEERVQKSRVIGPRSISKRGGSLQVTVPPEIARHLGLVDGSKIAYIIDEDSDDVTLARADRLEVKLSKAGKTATLGFTVHKELAGKLLKKKLER